VPQSIIGGTIPYLHARWLNTCSKRKVDDKDLKSQEGLRLLGSAWYLEAEWLQELNEFLVGDWSRSGPGSGESGSDILDRLGINIDTW
jgi:hypothetical protein